MYDIVILFSLVLVKNYFLALTGAQEMFIFGNHQLQLSKSPPLALEITTLASEIITFK